MTNPVDRPFSTPQPQSAGSFSGVSRPLVYLSEMVAQLAKLFFSKNTFQSSKNLKDKKMHQKKEEKKKVPSPRDKRR